MVRRAFLRWASAAAVAAGITFPQFGLLAQDFAPEPPQPNERVQKVVLSPVLAELERWNEARCESGGILYDKVYDEHGFPGAGIPVYSQTTGRLLGYAPTRKRSGKAYTLKSRRDLLVAFGGIQDSSEDH